jgi:glycosyltransferase involved in cell wall biosynthesis
MFKPTSKVLLVYQSPWDWDFLWNRSQPLATALSKYSQVVYLNHGVSTNYFGGQFLKFITRLLPTRYRKPVERFQWPVCDQIAGSIKGINWLGLTDDPWYSTSEDRSESSYRILRRIISQESAESDEVWLLTSRPAALGLLDTWHWDKILIDIEDPWVKLDWGLNNTTSAIHNFLEYANRVFANGPRLARHFTNSFNLPIYSLPNGVDDWFVNALSKERLPEPEMFNNSSDRLKVVFTGNLNNRIDYSDLCELVTTGGPFDFYFVGTDQVPSQDREIWSLIQKQQNVHWFPPVSHKTVATILKHADILLLPYRRAGHELMFPAKLFEYIAAAKPIITSDDFGFDSKELSCFYVCPSLEAMKMQLGEIGNASFQLSEETKRHCQAIASSNTWTARAVEFFEIVSK